MKIIHVMSDGTVRESIDGMTIPPTMEETYKILEKAVSEERKNKAKEQKTA